MVFRDAECTQLEQIEANSLFHAFCTHPADHDAATAAMTRMYSRINRPVPPILWFESPLQAVLTVAYLQTRRWRRLWRGVRTRCDPQMWNTFKDTFFRNFEDVADVSWDNVGMYQSFAPTPDRKRYREDTVARELQDEIARYFDPLNRANYAPVLMHDIFRDGPTLERLIGNQDWQSESEVALEPSRNQSDLVRSARVDAWNRIHPEAAEPLLTDFAIIERSVGWWWGLENVCLVTDRPCEIHFDRQQRLHNDTGPAIVYRDGWAVYALGGVWVPSNAVLAPETITVAQIESERNLETRRVLLERYGMARYLADSGAQEIHRDRFGVLYERKLSEGDPLVIVKVMNSTPEPDGSFREYFIRIPPQLRTAHRAVAWTFGLRPEQYQPLTEA
jgi:hypothetical protein